MVAQSIPVKAWNTASSLIRLEGSISRARLGALTALIRAKAWIHDLEPSDIGKGYPGVKEDGSEFNNDDLED